MKNKITTYLFSVLFLFCVTGLSHILSRENAGQIVMAYSLAFVAYFALLYFRKKGFTSISFLIGLGIIARLIATFSIPILSDDFWRFLWDGHLWNIGIHPFHFRPEVLMEQQAENLGDVLQNIYPNLNSKQYFTIYPPVCQAVFYTATNLFPQSVFGGVLVLKSFLFICEIGTIYLLYLLGKKAKSTERRVEESPWNLKHAAVLYALNPLAIIEVCGNIHFEGAAVFFVVLCLFSLQKLQNSGSKHSNAYLLLAAVALSLAIASKLIPAMYAPLIFIALPWKKALQFTFAVLVFCGLLFYPMLDAEAISSNAASIGLYFKTFEFNASVYYILRYFGTWYHGYNPIHVLGPFLGGMTLLTAVFLFFKTKKITGMPLLKFPWKRTISLEVSLYVLAFVYLLLSTTVHPWYVLLPFVLSLFTNSKMALVWTALIPMTYFRYAVGQESDVFGWIAVEYGILILAFLYFKYRKSAFL